mgnify:CR=1 FL=1
MSEKLEIELEKAQLIDELLFIETEIDALWRYSPDNPNREDVREALSRMKCLKEEIEEKLELLKD